MPAACRSSSVPAAVLCLQGPASRFWCSPIKRRCRSTRQNSKPHFSSSRPAGRSSHRETPDSITCHPSRSLAAGRRWSPCFCGCTCRSPAPRRCPQISAGRTHCSCRERQKHSSGAYRQQSCQFCSSTQPSPSLPAKPWSSPCSPWTHGFPDP